MSASIAPASSGAPTSVPPSSSAPSTFSVRVSENEQEVVFFGILRPFVADQMNAIRLYVEKAARKAARSGSGSLHLNFKRLKHMNNVAFMELNRLLRWSAQKYPDLKIKLIISSVIPWAIPKFQVMAELHPNVEVEVYDKTLYPIQQVIEDDEFINVLRTQSKIVWAREQEILHCHGLRTGMRIADIGCGLGDFAIQLQSNFRPAHLVGVDHSKPFLRQAQRIVREYGLESIEYQYGDAAALLLPDNSFDFVSCRLSLQVFDYPETILKELFRICKPGGRVYVTNEMMSCIIGYPGDGSIRAAYAEVIKMGTKLGMDMDFGIKTREKLLDADFEDIRIDLLEVNNLNTDPQDFAKIVESWGYVIKQMAAKTNTTGSLYEMIMAGHREHIEVIKSERGFASWPIYAGSGRKPYRIGRADAS